MPVPPPSEERPAAPHPPPDLSATIREAARRRLDAKVAEATRESNTLGTCTLFVKEMERFLNIALQSLVSPALTTMLWFLVFGYSLGGQLSEIRGIPYVDFLVPGLVMMAVITNAFINSGFSFFISKVHGTVTDLLVTPLTPNQIIIAYTGASVVRAVTIGVIIWVVAALMGASTLFHAGWTLAFLLLTSVGFAVLGLFIGILARDFDHVNFIPSFLLLPLTFLGGVFYSIRLLPSPWDTVSLFNPIVYMINGLRYGMTGVTDVSIGFGLAISVGTVAIGWAGTWWLLASGKKLRE